MIRKFLEKHKILNSKDEMERIDAVVESARVQFYQIQTDYSVKILELQSEFRKNMKNDEVDLMNYVNNE